MHAQPSTSVQVPAEQVRTRTHETWSLPTSVHAFRGRSPPYSYVQALPENHHVGAHPAHVHIQPYPSRPLHWSEQALYMTQASRTTGTRAASHPLSAYQRRMYKIHRTVDQRMPIHAACTHPVRTSTSAESKKQPSNVRTSEETVQFRRPPQVQSRGGASGPRTPFKAYPLPYNTNSPPVQPPTRAGRTPYKGPALRGPCAGAYSRHRTCTFHVARTSYTADTRCVCLPPPILAAVHIPVR